MSDIFENRAGDKVFLFLSDILHILYEGCIMNTSYGINAYKSHDLNIAMKTSSGDVIKMDFSNQQAGSFSQTKNANGTSTSASFSSMQSFQFSIDTNGISTQDQKEIDEFMKIAQPFIDDFLKELQMDAPKSPVTQLANQIASIFEPSKQRDDNEKNFIKNNIVKAFDNSLENLQPKEENETSIDKIFKDMQKLLEKTLQIFEQFNKNIYA